MLSKNVLIFSMKSILIIDSLIWVAVTLSDMPGVSIMSD